MNIGPYVNLAGHIGHGNLEPTLGNVYCSHRVNSWNQGNCTFMQYVKSMANRLLENDYDVNINFDQLGYVATFITIVIDSRSHVSYINIPWCLLINLFTCWRTLWQTATGPVSQGCEITGWNHFREIYVCVQRASACVEWVNVVRAGSRAVWQIQFPIPVCDWRMQAEPAAVAVT